MSPRDGPATGEVHVVVPAGIDDVGRPSGGNVYDRRLCDALAARRWEVREHLVPGDWPRPTQSDEDRLDRELATVPEDAVVIVDGLVGSATSVVPARLAARSGPTSEPGVPTGRSVMLVHMPLTEQFETTERAALAAVDAVVTTSHWARDRLIDRHGLDAGRVHVVEPGIDPVEVPATPSTTGGRLLHVAAVTPDKGHDTLLTALEQIRDLAWSCTCVGSLDVEPEFADQIAAAAERRGLGGRLRFSGTLPADPLRALRADTDLAVSTSRRESYGMATAEALAHGVPVVASAVGGQPEAVGRAPDGTRPGLLVPPDDPDALADALRRWLTEPALRTTLHRAAVRRSSGLSSWPDVAARFVDVLGGMNRSRAGDVLPHTARRGGMTT